MAVWVYALAAASALIAHNVGRLGKTLRPGRPDPNGERVMVVGLWDSDDEARMVRLVMNETEAALRQSDDLKQELKEERKEADRQIRESKNQRTPRR